MSPVREHISSELQKLRRALLVVGGVLLVVVCAAGWTSEYRSCVRSQTIREVSKTNRESNQRLARYYRAKAEWVLAREFQGRVQASREIKPLDCFAILPQA